MKKRISTSVLFALCATAVLSGCGVKKNNESIDSTKTQIFVNNFRRGFGSVWLDALKQRFEDENKDISYEEGKTGVQVIINNEGRTADSRMGSIAAGRDEIYFTEQSYYFDLMTYNGDNLLADITDVVTEKMTEYGETRSIEDKMTDEQKEYYGVADGESKKYYAVPHYSGFFGLNYDVDLFDKMGFYFAETPLAGARGQFINKNNPVKSSGPNGILGDWDDGLPRTFDEFFELCDYILYRNCIPWIANSVNTSDYLNLLVNSVAADHEGKDQMFNKFKASGTMTDLGTVDAEGNVTKLPATAIDKDTGYKAYQMLGNYYGVKFLKKLYDGSSDGTAYYYDQLVKSTGFSAETAQNEFLKSRPMSDDETSGKKPIAFISEGIWWEAESSETSKTLADQYGSEYSKENRRFAFMPFPKATQERWVENRKNTLFDHLFSLIFIKKNVPAAKMPLVKKFLKFVNTDVSLREFTSITNTPKALNYEMLPTDYDKMTYYGKTLIQLKNASDVIYPGNGSQIYINNSSNFHTNNQYFSSPSAGVEVQYVWNGIHQKKLSAESYFSGMLNYYRDNWKNNYK